jgi:hypothetical protein
VETLLCLLLRVVLAHPRAVFHPYTCRLRGDTAMFAAARIDYDDCGGCYCDDQKEEAIVIDYFFYTNA